METTIFREAFQQDEPRNRSVTTSKPPEGSLIFGAPAFILGPMLGELPPNSPFGRMLASQAAKSRGKFEAACRRNGRNPAEVLEGWSRLDPSTATAIKPAPATRSAPVAEPDQYWPGIELSGTCLQFDQIITLNGKRYAYRRGAFGNQQQAALTVANSEQGSRSAHRDDSLVIGTVTVREFGHELTFRCDKVILAEDSYSLISDWAFKNSAKSYGCSVGAYVVDSHLEEMYGNEVEVIDRAVIEHIAIGYEPDMACKLTSLKCTRTFQS